METNGVDTTAWVLESEIIAETQLIGTGKRNAANGYAGLNESGLLTESQIPSSIARDTEVRGYLGDLISAPAAFIPDPAGGNADNEARAAIIAIRDVMIAKGLIAAS